MNQIKELLVSLEEFSKRCILGKDIKKYTKDMGPMWIINEQEKKSIGILIGTLKDIIQMAGSTKRLLKELKEVKKKK